MYEIMSNKGYNLIDLSTKIRQLQEINWLHFSVEEQKKWNRDFEDTVGLLIKKVEQNNLDASVLGEGKISEAKEVALGVDYDKYNEHADLE